MIYVIVASITKALLSILFGIVLSIILVIFGSLAINSFIGKIFFERFENRLFMQLWYANHNWINSFPKLPMKKEK